MIPDSILDDTPGLQTIAGARAWTRAMSPSDRALVNKAWDEITAIAAKGTPGHPTPVDLGAFAWDQVALLGVEPSPTNPNGHPGGMGTLGPFNVAQKIANGPMSQAKPYDANDTSPTSQEATVNDLVSDQTWTPVGPSDN